MIEINYTTALIFIQFPPPFFLARSQNCEKRQLALSCMSACLSVRMDQLGSHCTDFYQILYLSISRNPVDKIEVSLKSDENITHS